jgi:hypothetical protein
VDLEPFTIADCNTTPGRAEMPGVRERIFWGRCTTITLSDLDPCATVRLPPREHEYWFLLLSGDGWSDEQGVETPISAGALWRPKARSQTAFRAGPGGARIIEFCATTRSAAGLNYAGHGELPAGTHFD